MVLSQISRAFYFRDQHIFKSLYIQYVRPHLEYKAVSWRPWFEADKDVIEKLQKRAVSMVSGLKGATYEEKLQKEGHTTMEKGRHQADMAQTFKIIHRIVESGHKCEDDQELY
jgi:hypothetical protein